MSFFQAVVRSVAGPLAVALTAAAAPGQETEPPRPAIDPKAIEIAEAAIEHLSRQPRIALEWFVSYDVIVDGREKITYTRSGENLLSRGEGFYSYAESRERIREYFFDGGTFWIHNVEDNAYVALPFAGRFDELVQRIRVEYDIPLPIWELLSREGTDELLSDLEAAAYLGEIRFAGRAAHHLAFAKYDQDWQIWVSTDPANPVILSLVGTNPYEQGWPQYRAYFHDWDFAPDIEEGAFAFSPPEDAIRMTMPKVESRAAEELDLLLSQGARSDSAGGQNAN